MRKRMTLGLQIRQSRGYGFWKGGKEVFECKNVPPFVILIIWCRGGSPRRANLHIFLFLFLFFFFFLRGILTMSPPFSWISILPNLNLLRLELGVDYLFYYIFSFLKQTNSKRKLQNTKDTGLPCSDILCLPRAVTPTLLASVLKYLQVINNQVWPILTASLPYLDWFLPFMFCLHSRR